MSRSQPTADSPNPTTRWFEWGGKEGKLSYYDKVKKEVVNVPLPFVCIVLDSTNTIRGYNKKMKTGLFSNEIRDTRVERLVVKFFSGGVAAEGLWADIKDRVVARSGKFAKNLYIVYRDVDVFKIGCVQLTGCAMSAWFDFEKANKKGIMESALVIRPGKQDTSGDVAYIPPLYSLKEVSAETNATAIALDKQLQEYFTHYFRRTTSEKVDRPPASDTPPAGHEPEQPWGGEPEAPPDDTSAPPPPPEDDVPF